jgi:glycosyltransferase involved in cell wall biosynthesis
MTISILMAVYIKDDPVHLNEALRSLLPFSVKVESLILVADGALTSSLESVIDSFVDILPMRLVRLPESRGLGEALNAGLREAKSTFILRMDSDDLCRTNRLEVLLKYLEENPNIDVLGSYIAEFTDSPELTKYIRKVPLTHHSINIRMRRSCAMNHVSCLIRRDRLIKAGGYIGGKGFAEDWWLWARLLSTGAIFANVPEILVDVRLGNGFIDRRRGVWILRHDFRLIQLMLAIGFINRLQAIHIFISKLIQRLSPKVLLQLIYTCIRN